MEFDLSFSCSSSKDANSFKLIQLTPDLSTLLENAIEHSADIPSLTIKGSPDDDAVLCTADRTYALRSVVLSNSVLVVTAPSTNTANTVVVRDQLSEFMELVPAVPRLHKLDGILRGLEYGEGQAEADAAECGSDCDPDEEEEDERPAKKRRFTYDDARTEIQASELELARGIREKRILNINDQLHPMVPSYLRTVLELILNYLVSLSLPHDAAPVRDLTAPLIGEHDVPKQVATQVMSWFGDVHAGIWSMDVDAVLKEIGLGILREHKDDPVSETEFIESWRTAVGDKFESSVSLSLLSGNYIITPSLTRDVPEQVLTYFPSASLPVDPSARFADLFLTRSRWKEDEIAPFLSEIAVDAKEREKLLLRYARATTDVHGVWYTARH